MAEPRIISEVPGLPPREATTHKGRVGRVAIVAGNRGMSGAAVLAGSGALRGGAGLVRIYTPESVYPIVAASEPCYMPSPLPELRPGELDADAALAEIDLEWPTVLAIGPGLGQTDAARRLTLELIRTERPLVLDADALNHLAAHASAGTNLRDLLQARGRHPTVITPHPGEMARLCGAAGLAELSGTDDKTRVRCAHAFAELAGVVVVLKGHRTVVATPTEAFINRTGNPGMATGGMGDVLTGLIAALIGQGLDAFAAARMGVCAHGLAADRCAERIGPVGYTARDVAEALPGALAQASRPSIGFR